MNDSINCIRAWDRILVELNVRINRVCIYRHKRHFYRSL